jgi:flavin reductase
MPPINIKETPIPAQSIAATDFSPRDFRDAMGRFATGVVVITTEVEGDAHAMTANAFMSGSMEPTLIIVSVAHTAKMHDKIQNAGLFGVSILTEEQQAASNHFAGRSMPDYTPEFQRLWQVPVLADATVQLAAQVKHAYPCGDHTLFVGEVQQLVLSETRVEPLVYHKGRYLNLAQAA